MLGSLVHILLPMFLTTPLLEKTDNASPAVAVTKDGQVMVAVAVRGKNRERIWVRQIGKKARAVTNGVRAWHPSLAVAPHNHVWLAWCGVKKHPRRGIHRRDVMVRRISPRLGPVVRVSKPGTWSCNPTLVTDNVGRLHVVWEEETRIAYRRLSPKGRIESPIEYLSEGSLSRRPDVVACGDEVHVAFDSLVDEKPSGGEDPDYDVFLQSGTLEGFDKPVTVDQRAGIQAAPDLACAPGGGVLVAYHTSHAHSLIKWWTIRRVKDGKVEELTAQDPSDVKEPKGEVQGAEFPELVVLKDRLAVISRPSQGAYLQTVDAAGISPVRKLNRHEWGARGMRTLAAVAKDGSLLVVRRGRDQSILERITFDTAGSGYPVFSPVKDAKKQAPAAPPVKKPESWSGLYIYFGDIHMHSAATDGTGPPDEIYARAWVRGHDFAVLTDHDVLAGRRLFPSLRDEIAWITDVFNHKQGFSTLQAYEWTTPALPRGSGHRNVYFRSHAPRLICEYKGRCPNSKKLNRALKKKRAIAVPHHTAWTGTDWKNADEKIQRQFEIVSIHGANENPGYQHIQSRGKMKGMYAQDGLAAGLKFGFVGGSDAHGLLWHHGIGRQRDPWGCGLTGVLAKGNSREELFDAMQARQTFATSGEKLWALLRVGEVLLGGEGVVRPPVVIHYGLIGTRPLDYFEIVRDGKVVFRDAPRGKTLSMRDGKIEAGAERKLNAAVGKWVDENVPPGPHVYYLRVAQEAGGAKVDMAWASPVFVTVLEGDK